MPPGGGNPLREKAHRLQKLPSCGWTPFAMGETRRDKTPSRWILSSPTQVDFCGLFKSDGFSLHNPLIVHQEGRLPTSLTPQMLAAQRPFQGDAELGPARSDACFSTKYKRFWRRPKRKSK